MNLKTRMGIERRIARQAARDLIAAGYTVTVHDGETKTLKHSTNLRAIVGAMFTTDDDYLLAYDGTRCVGWVRFIYGNDGYDVINDYTTNLETVLTETHKLALKLELRHG